MADISKLSVLQDAVVENIDLSTNALVVGSLKIGAGELTALILNNLISLQNGSDFADGSSSHTHDARYFTRALLESTTNGEGASLIAVEDAANNFTSGNIEGVLAELATLAGAAITAADVSYDPSSSSFTQTTVQATLDEAAGRLDTNETNISNNAATIATKANDSEVLKKDGSVALEGNMSLGGNRFSDLGAPVNPNDAVRLIDLEAVQAGGLGKDPVKAASQGNLSGYNPTGGTSGNGSFTGVSMTQDGVVLVNGDRLLVPNQTDLSQNGIYVVVDSVTGDLERATDADGTPSSEVRGGNSVFVENGNESGNTLYQLKGTGDLVPNSDDQEWIIYSRLEALTGGQGIVKTGKSLAVDTDGESLGFNGSDQLEVKLDGASLSKSASGVKVADGGVGSSQIADDAVVKEKIAADVAGNGLGQNVDGSLEVNVDDSTIEVATDSLQVKDGGITDAKVASGSKLEEAVQFHTDSDITGAEAEQLTDGSSADSLHRHEGTVAEKTSGEAFGANISKVVRFGTSGETAGRVYLATNANAIVDKRYNGIGILLSTAPVSAGVPTLIRTSGTHTLGSGDTNFNAADIGLPVYLTTAGDFTVTPPVAGVGETIAAYQIGFVEDLNKIFINFNLNGIDVG